MSKFATGLTFVERVWRRIMDLTSRVTAIENQGGPGANIYNADGTLDGDRTVSLDANDLTFQGPGTLFIDTPQTFIGPNVSTSATTGFVAVGVDDVRISGGNTNPVLIQDGTTTLYSLPKTTPTVGDLVKCTSANTLEFYNEWVKITINPTIFATIPTASGAATIYNFDAGEILEHCVFQINSKATLNTDVNTNAWIGASDYYGVPDAYVTGGLFFGAGSSALPQSIGMDMVAFAYNQPVAPMDLGAWTLKIFVDNSTSGNIDTITDGELTVYIKKAKLPGF
jgi:hypothetical protein